MEQEQDKSSCHPILRSGAERTAADLQRVSTQHTFAFPYPATVLSHSKGNKLSLSHHFLEMGGEQQPDMLETHMRARRWHLWALLGTVSHRSYFKPPP